MPDETPTKEAAPDQAQADKSVASHGGSGAMFPPACPANPSEAGNPTAPYRLLDGPQVEPLAGWWTTGPAANLPRVVQIDEVLALTNDSSSAYYVPPYPTDKDAADWEIGELAHLQANRDNPGAVTGNYSVAPPASLATLFADTTREQLSDFIHLDPPPFGAIFNIGTRPQYAVGNINQQHLRRQLFLNGVLPPVVRTGRQLARMFESDTPGHVHRNAVSYLLYKREDLSPPRQARIWMALDVAIYSALAAAWYYKWAAPTSHRFRQRPYEYDQNQHFRVLFDDRVDDLGVYNKCPRPGPCPSPGSPRHPAYPSGHSTFSAAASEILKYFFPEEATQFDRLANNIGTARLWAGVHWRSDHVAGQQIGRAVAELLKQQLMGDCIPPASPPGYTTPPSHAQVAADAAALRAGPCHVDQDKVATQQSTPFSDCGQARSAL